MPGTLFSLAILVLLLIPGMLFVIQVDNRRPTRDLSALRELIAIAAVGTLCDSIALMLFGTLRICFPKVTPDVGSLVLLGSAYVRLHFVSVVWWIAGLLTFSCGLAYLLGRCWPGVAGAVASGRITFTSSWWELFHMHPGTRIYVGCELDDGSYIAGYLLRYSTEADETPDRELSLTIPISYRPQGSTETRALNGVGAVSVRASQMKFMTVSYMQIQNSSDLPTEVDADQGQHKAPDTTEAGEDSLQPRELFIALLVLARRKAFSKVSHPKRSDQCQSRISHDHTLAEPILHLSQPMG